MGRRERREMGRRWSKKRENGGEGTRQRRREMETRRRETGCCDARGMGQGRLAGEGVR